MVRNDVYARLAHGAYNKGVALAEIARRWGVGREHILAAGDHLNDLPMLTLDHAHWLVTNANAVEMVKEAVRRQNGFVSRHSFSRGVAEGLKHCFESAQVKIIQPAT